MSIHLAHNWILVTFIAGYLVIIFEHLLKINKSATALFIAALCWMFYFVSGQNSMQESTGYLSHHMSDVSQIILFLLGAMAIVELIDTHKGFDQINKIIATRSKRRVLIVVSLLTFFLSAILDNLTTTILMISLVKKLVPFQKERLPICCMIVIAANAGGAWTPIGDVTTTMLWINGQLSTMGVIKALFLPSLVCMIVPLLWFIVPVKGTFSISEMDEKRGESEVGAKIVLVVGILGLVAVPFFKWATGLPPFMGIILALALLWIITDLLHEAYPHRQHLRVPSVLAKIDISSVLFFLGILLAVDALQAVGFLETLARELNHFFSNVTSIATFIGLLSAVIDNVPLVAATIGMYDLNSFPIDSNLWMLIAYAAGTGGSVLIIGSAAGVALMGLEKIDFITYLKKASLPALLGYFAGIGIYLLV